MRFFFGLRGRRLAVLVTAMFALAGGVDYATSVAAMDTATTIKACMLNGLGTIRS
jgi:hypothetical protein